MLFIEIGETWQEKFWGEDQMLSFRHVKCEMPVKVFKHRYQINV